jgi:acetyl/propionyl-CoA carboxylase alpha subunit
MPQPGTVKAIVLPTSESIRIDHGIAVGCQISPHYDPLLAKLTAWSPQRAGATRSLLHALAETRLEVVGKQGLRENNLQLLQQILGAQQWADASYDTRIVEHVMAIHHERPERQRVERAAPATSVSD